MGCPLAVSTRYTPEGKHTGHRVKGLIGDCGKDFFDVSNEKNCTIDIFVV